MKKIIGNIHITSVGTDIWIDKKSNGYSNPNATKKKSFSKKPTKDGWERFDEGIYQSSGKISDEERLFAEFNGDTMFNEL